ncbi:TPA: decarboxylating cobalt-precorrin-6B (C(15))-methyltransferase [Klebsiella pneumoniae]
MKDELFLRGAQVPMTKEAVRALALAKLELHRARHLIDIGAGTGSVSIEAALQNPALRVTAIERQADALRLLAVADKADAIFMGGSGGHLTALIDWSLAQLHPGGRLVMTFILQENLHSALAHLRQSGIHEVDCQQLAVSTLATLGSGHYFKPHNPVFVIACQKEENHG